MITAKSHGKRQSARKAAITLKHSSKSLNTKLLLPVPSSLAVITKQLHILDTHCVWNILNRTVCLVRRATLSARKKRVKTLSILLRSFKNLWSVSRCLTINKRWWNEKTEGLLGPCYSSPILLGGEGKGHSISHPPFWCGSRSFDNSHVTRLLNHSRSSFSYSFISFFCGGGGASFINRSKENRLST